MRFVRVAVMAYATPAITYRAVCLRFLLPDYTKTIEDALSSLAER